MNIDLHCHTNLSDGSLSPEELVTLAHERNIDVLAITDHDNIDCHHQLSSLDTDLKLISGIEFSTTWRNMGVHIVGLNMDLSNKDLLAGIEFQTKGSKCAKLSQDHPRHGSKKQRGKGI